MTTSLKRVGYDLLIEILAVFIAITAALFFENRKEERTKSDEIKSYFGLIRHELVKDTLFISHLSEDVQHQYNAIDSFINNPVAGHVQLLRVIEDASFLQTRSDFLSGIQSSNSFNLIYDTAIFNVLNNTMTDFELYNNIQLSIDQSQKELVRQYIYRYKNYQTGQIDYNVVFKSSVFMNELINFNGLLSSRYTALISLRRNYNELLIEIDKTLADKTDG